MTGGIVPPLITLLFFHNLIPFRVNWIIYASRSACSSYAMPFHHVDFIVSWVSEQKSLPLPRWFFYNRRVATRKQTRVFFFFFLISTQHYKKCFRKNTIIQSFPFVHFHKTYLNILYTFFWEFWLLTAVQCRLSFLQNWVAIQMTISRA